MEPIRLNKLLAERGVASRREADDLISTGRVTVDGRVGTVEERVDPDEVDVRVDGTPLPEAPPRVYFLLYKPKGYITGRDDPRGRKSVLELVEHLPVRVEPVGRLDFDTEGALLLTNDGVLAHKLTHPSSAVPKRYRAKVYRTPDERDLALIRQGKVFLEDGATLPAKVRVVEQTDTENAWVEITVTEGRNRLIRRMFEKLGHPVAKLRRESFATLSLRGMERGDVRPLTSEEVRRIQDLANGTKPKNAGRLKRGKGFAKPKPKKKRHGQHKTKKRR
ncbi:MAG: pseudouridine synthase [Myxococcota bacterium]